MSRVPSRLSFAGHRVLVVMQVFLLIATLFAPIPAAAQDPTGDPGASAPPSTEPAATPEPTPDPTPHPTSEPTPAATPEPPAASPDPTPEPTAEPPTAEPPAATPEPTPEQPTPSPDTTPAPTTQPSTPTGTPTIQSDLADYPPGGLVTLTGSGWQPGESVHIYVNDDWGSSWSRNVDVTADASGDILDQFNLPNWFVAVYRVVATGAESGLASTSFTDASLMVKRGPTGNPPNLQFNIGVVRGFSTNTCSSGGDARPDVTVSTDAGSSVTGLGSGSFVKLTAPTNPTSPSGYQFVNWTAESDSPSTGFPNTALSICVRNPTGSVDDVYRANYQRLTATTVTRTTGNASNSYGEALVFTATVTSLAGNPSSAGNVTFKDGAAVLCAAVALAGNQATCSGSSLNVAGSPHSITAVYSGASGPPAFSASTSASLSQTISKATLVVDANDKSRDYGDPNPVLDATITGFKNGETLATSGVAGSPLCTSTATATSPVSGSPYAITCALGSLTAGNYSFTFTPGALTITKASSTTTVTCPASITYSGAALTPCSASVTGAGGLNQAVTVTYLNNTNAGTATANASYAGDANHTGSSDSDTFTIDPASSTTTVTCPASITYSGAALTPCSASVTGAGGLNQAVTVTYLNNTNAGTATANASYAGDANHTGSSDSDTFTIDPASSTTTVTCPASITYSGAALTPCSASVTGAGGLNQAVTVTYLNNTNAGTATANASYAGDANHTGSSDSDTFTIDKANAVCTVTGYDVVYDAAAHTATGSCLGVEGETLVGLDLSDTTHTNAGTYADDPWTFTDVTGNYNDTSGTVDDEIDKANAVCTVTGYDVVYDAAAHTATGSCLGVEGETLVGLDLSDTTHTNAGTYADDPWTFTDVTGNYNDTSGTVDDEIDKANAVCTVTGYDVVYDAAAHTATGSCLGVEGETLVGLDLSDTTHTNAGTYADDPWTFTDVTGNYNDTSGTVDDEIDKAPSSTVVTCLAGPFVYSGSAHTPCSASVTGAGGLSETLTVSYTDNVDAGTASASAGYAGDANHEASSDSETFTIDKAPSSTVVTCLAGPFVYSGSAHTPCSASVTGAGGLSETLTVSYTDNVDAGTASASAGYAGDANHEASSDSETFTIDKAPSSTVVTCLAGPFVYSGSAHTPCSASVTGAGGLSETLTVSYTDNVDAGTASASAGYAGDANHEASSDSETFTIDKAPSSTVVTCLAGPFVYSGSAHTPCSASVTGAGGLSETLTVSYTDNVDAGTASASAGYAGDANHEASSDSETFTIDKAPSSTVVTFEAGPHIYRGTPFTATALATGVGGLSTAVVVVYSGDCTNVTVAGGCTATATFAGDLNHNGSGDTKSIRILKKNVTGAFTAADKVWDGTNLATVVSRSVSEVIPGDMVSLSGGTATFASSMVGTWTVTLTGAALTGPAAGNYNLTSVGTDTAAITTAFRIVGFDSPVDMTVEAHPRIYNSVKNGQTVPLKFRVFNLDGTEVTSTVGLSAWAKSVACLVGEVDPVLLPTELASNTGLRRTGDRFHFNWAVPKSAGQCYRVFIQTVDGSTEMVGTFNSSTKLEAYFRSK